MSKMNTVAEVVVKRIKEILNEKGMSIYRLEKITAMSHNTMQTLMRADNNSVNLKTVLLVIRGLGVTTADFFNSPMFDDEDLDIDESLANVTYDLKAFSKALDFTLISEGFQNNRNLQDDAQLLKVRLYALIHGPVGKLFQGLKYVTYEEFISGLLNNGNKKSQIININLEGLDDNISKV